MKLILYRKLIQNSTTKIFGVANGEVSFCFHMEILTVKVSVS